MCLAIPRPVRRTCAVLGDPDRDAAGQCFWPGYRSCERTWQYRWFCRTLHRRLAKDGVSQHCDPRSTHLVWECCWPPHWLFYCRKVRNKFKRQRTGPMPESIPRQFFSGDFSQLKINASAGGSRIANWLASNPGGMKCPRRVFKCSSINAGGPVRCTNFTRESPPVSSSRYFAFNAEQVSTENSFFTIAATTIFLNVCSHCSRSASVRGIPRAFWRHFPANENRHLHKMLHQFFG